MAILVALALALGSAPAAADQRAAMAALCELIPTAARDAEGIDCQADACLWPTSRVTCDGGGAVVVINLRGIPRLDMAGVIPSEIGWLASLRELRLQLNSLSGSVPTELGRLTNLTMLNLGANALTGAIPSELGGLSCPFPHR